MQQQINSIPPITESTPIKSTIYAQGKQRGYSTTTATPEPSPLGLGILKENTIEDGGCYLFHVC